MSEQRGDPVALFPYVNRHYDEAMIVRCRGSGEGGEVVMDKALQRYRDNPAFHVIAETFLRVIESCNNELSMGEIRDAFKVALIRHEMLTVRPVVAPETLTREQP